MIVEAGPYLHVTASGTEYHLDHQLTREQLDVLHWLLLVRGLGPQEVCSVHLPTEAPPVVELRSDRIAKLQRVSDIIEGASP